VHVYILLKHGEQKNPIRQNVDIWSGMHCLAMSFQHHPLSRLETFLISCEPDFLLLELRIRLAYFSHYSKTLTDSSMQNKAVKRGKASIPIKCVILKY